MSRVILKGSSCPITVKNVESEILHAKFPNSINNIKGITFYENYITFTNNYGREMFVPLSSVQHIEFIKEVVE